MAESTSAATHELVKLETHPSQYKHWQLSVDDKTGIATLGMNVNEQQGLGDYVLKQNSYDLGVDVELADAVQRLRFEHPEAKAVVITGLKDKVFCAGANIHMLGSSSHAFKVNFCKYTNETRLGIEDASASSGLKFLAALNGTAAGGGYELALACDKIILIDDANSAVSFPEVPLLGVLPGTGGLTRITDKRKVRRDLCDVFSTVAEGVKGKRAVEWNLVDAVVPKSSWSKMVLEHATSLAATSDRPGASALGQGVTLSSIEPQVEGTVFHYKYVTLTVDTQKRTAVITLKAPTEIQPSSAEAMHQMGDQLWALRCYREFDDALLRLRLHFIHIGFITILTEGDTQKLLAAEAALLAAQHHWFAREVLHHMKRVLKRVDVTSRTLMAEITSTSAYAGSFAEILLAVDRSFMLDDASASNPATIALSPISLGSFPMGNGLTRLEARYYGDEAALKKAQEAAKQSTKLDASTVDKMGLVTFVRDEIDYPDEVRLFIEERTALSPDALTGMEANLRFVGPESMETRIFGRLSAWQNWIFIRDNATGPQGALTHYGKPTRPQFDYRRT